RGQHHSKRWYVNRGSKCEHRENRRATPEVDTRDVPRKAKHAFGKAAVPAQQRQGGKRKQTTENKTLAKIGMRGADINQQRRCQPKQFARGHESMLLNALSDIR